jgi:hypothetical protein
MAIIQSGVTTDLLTVDPGTKAARVTPKPTEYGALGHYKWGGITGVLPAALAANSEIFQFRWANASNLALITKVRISACVSTTFFAAGVPVQIDLRKANSWTVAGTGGPGVTPAGDLKARTSGMGNTLLVAGDMRIATTAALGTGTKTLESNSMATLVAPGPLTASLNGQIIAPGTTLWEPDTGDGEHPLLLGTNEGFVIRSVAVPATGTWMAAIYINWTELTSY